VGALTIAHKIPRARNPPLEYAIAARVVQITSRARGKMQPLAARAVSSAHQSCRLHVQRLSRSVLPASP
jgi:hypothetical protein